ncbi:hypothetical protein R3P38DRAFT_2974211 [Favolaschia claudopus]|uniref:Uncharacterized protein n=1 Tax=Favolaschia claudopus TaxID=2862362 RepID=A0AAW0B4J6_9AGAR
MVLAQAIIMVATRTVAGRLNDLEEGHAEGGGGAAGLVEFAFAFGRAGQGNVSMVRGALCGLKWYDIYTRRILFVAYLLTYMMYLTTSSICSRFS